MFAFLLRFYDENSTIYMIVCCSMLLLWLYFVYMEFFPSPVDRNRLGMDSCGQQKSETRTISCDFMCKEIPWIKGEVEYYIRMHRFAKKKTSHTLLNANKILYLHSAKRMQQIFHKYCNKFGEALIHQHTTDMDRFCEQAN